MPNVPSTPVPQRNAGRALPLALGLAVASITGGCNEASESAASDPRGLEGRVALATIARTAATESLRDDSLALLLRAASQERDQPVAAQAKAALFDALKGPSRGRLARALFGIAPPSAEPPLSALLLAAASEGPDAASFGSALQADWIAATRLHEPRAKAALLSFASQAGYGPEVAARLLESSRPSAAALSMAMALSAASDGPLFHRAGDALEASWLAADAEQRPDETRQVLELYRIRPSLLTLRLAKLASPGSDLTALAPLLWDAIAEVAVQRENEVQVQARAWARALWPRLRTPSLVHLRESAGQRPPEDWLRLAAMMPPQLTGEALAKAEREAPLPPAMRTLLCASAPTITELTAAWLRAHEDPRAALARFTRLEAPLRERWLAWRAELPDGPLRTALEQHLQRLQR